MRNGAGSPMQLARSASRAEVLKVVQNERIISRSSLATRVSVSRATVSGVVAEMLRAGILEEIGEDASTGGRRPMRLRYRSESRNAIGVVLLDAQVQAVLTDLQGHPLRDLEMPTRALTPADMIATMGEVVRRLLDGGPHERVLGVGVGTPGIVNSDTGTIEISVSKGWLSGSIRVKEALEASLGLPVHVANRSRVAALGELKVGVGQGLSNLIYLFLGQGIVASIVIDGHLYTGPSFGAGEIGHVSLFADGPICKCGNRGCLEVYAAEDAILARARAAARQTPGSLMHRVADNLDRLTFGDFVEAGCRGDPAAMAVLEETGTKIGMALAILINLLNPQMVILGGPVGRCAGTLLLDPVLRETQRRALSRSFVRTRIVSGQLGTHAEAIGAAVLAINQTPVNVLLDVWAST